LLKTTPGSIDFYDFEEYERLVAAAAALDPRAHLLILLGGDAGLRSGEMRALAWTDINFAKRQLCVERTSGEAMCRRPRAAASGMCR
jgi:integrase